MAKRSTRIISTVYLGWPPPVLAWSLTFSCALWAIPWATGSVEKAWTKSASSVVCLLAQMLNPFTFISHWSGFKVKLTFHGIQFFGSSLYTGQILGILCLQIDLFLTVECIWYNLGQCKSEAKGSKDFLPIGIICGPIHSCGQPQSTHN